MQGKFEGVKQRRIFRVFWRESEREVQVLVRSIRVLGVLAAVLGLGNQQASATEAAQRPFVPRFWDPDVTPERPDLEGIGVIRFLTTDDYPPFGFALANGAPAGFEVDLARALCGELQVTCTIQSRAWDGILPALEHKEADAAIASIAITGEARRTVSFTTPYYKTPARFVAHRPPVPAEEDPGSWTGKRVGVVAGTAHEAYLRRFFPQLTAVTYPADVAVRAALKSGAVDAAFGDAITWSNWLGGSDAAACCAFVGGAYTEEAFFGQGAGIAVRKTDIVLRRALDFALSSVAAKGIYGDIYLRYFPLGLY